MLVCDHARGLIEDNDISSNARAGVAILSGGNPTVRGNKIHHGKDSGVLVSEKVRQHALYTHPFHSPPPSASFAYGLLPPTVRLGPPLTSAELVLCVAGARAHRGE